MRLKSFPFLLVLLVASAWLDDTWAAVPPDPAEERLAVLDNEYIYVPARTGEERARPAPLPPSGRAVRPAGAPPCPPHYPSESARFSTPFGTPLLYILMSLQR
jgi:hypothetical protein